MEITGRLTKDAAVQKVTDGREVVRFSLVLNDRYRTKAGETKEVSTFIDCSYWVSSKVVKILTKGSIVTVYGRIGLNAYTGKGGEAKASLTFHTNDIRLVAFYKKEPATIDNIVVQEQMDDLPF